MMKYIITTILTLLTSQSYAEKLTKVSVLNNEFEVVSVITDLKELSEFEGSWELKNEVMLRSQPEWTYKIDTRPGNRWLYNEIGYVKVLSKKSVTIYKIDNVTQFNKLLKINNKAKPADSL